MGKYQANLPSVLNPVGDICVEVKIPAHPDYVKLFVRAIRMLEVNRMYERDEALSAKIVCEQWRDRTVNPVIEALATGTGMCGVDGECLAYPPFASFISFYPQNPYTEPDLVPPDFLAPPFFVNGKDAAHDLPNYEKGDIIVNFAAINLEPVWNLDNTPRIELCLEGSGVVELHLLKTVQGGAAVISVDNPIDLGDIISGVIGAGIEIISLNQDIISLPPETAEEVIIEQEITTEGEHTLYIYFLPTLDDSLIPLFFGGGLREISLCGNIRPCGTPAPEPPPPLEGVTELKPEFQFTADCGLEYQLRDQNEEIVQGWTAVAGWVDNAALCFGVGASMATKDDIRDGMYEAFNRLAAQVVSGRYLNISIDDEGNITDPSLETPEGELPVDDPATPDVNESLEAQNGGSVRVVDYLQQILTSMETWRSGTVTAQQAEDRLVLLYGFEQANANVFAQYYYTVYAGATGVITLNESTLDSLFFCRGVSIATFSKYIFESHATAGEVPALEVLAENLNQQQLTNWFNEGTQFPATKYLIYSCTKIATEEATLDMSTAETVTVNLSGVWKNNHRYRVQVSGTFTDSDNADVINDAFWSINTSTGVKTFQGASFISTAGVVNLTSAEVPYQPSHAYNVIVEKTGGSASGQLSRSNAPFDLPNTTGILTAIITDEGEFVV